MTDEANARGDRHAEGFKRHSHGYDPDMRALLTGVTLAGLAAISLAGCAPTQAEGVRATAVRFYKAYSNDEPGVACDQLAPRTKSELEQSAGKPCAEALPEEDVPEVDEPLAVHVFGSQAEVTWSGESTFLARFQGGWKVMAAACAERSDQPYDCAISGG